MAVQKINRIVILGAGFGGLTLALELEKVCEGKNCEVILIDRRVDHVYAPLLYEVATGYLDRSTPECVGELRGGLCIKFENYTTIIGSKMIRFAHGEITKVDELARTVQVAGGQEISYDYLVVALGSEVDDYGIPGVRENSFTLKSLEDAFRIRKRFRQFIDKHLAGEKERIHAVICGAGATGVEMASELATFFERLRKAEIIQHRHFAITLVEAGPVILGPFDMTTRRFTENRLRSLGIEIMVDTAVKEVRATEAVLTRKDSAEPVVLASDITIWCGGIRGSRALELIESEKDKKGRLVVDELMRVTGKERIFAIGDCSVYIAPHTTTAAPALAQVAIAEAKGLARNLAREMAGHSMQSVRLPAHWNSVMPLGGKYAVATAGGFHFRGLLGYALRKLADLHYFMSILPWHYALHIWWRGALVYMRND